jgi:hypothetical protein
VARCGDWRNPEIIIFRDKRGTFTARSRLRLAAVLIMLLVHGQTTVAAPFYG